MSGHSADGDSQASSSFQVVSASAAASGSAGGVAVAASESDLSNRQESMDVTAAASEPDLSKLQETIREAIFSCSEPQVLQLPWEMPGLDLIFGKGALDQILPAEPPKIVFPVPTAADAPIEEQAKAAKRVKTAAFGQPCFRGCVNFKNVLSDAELEAGAWQRSLEKWHFILTLDPSVSLARTVWQEEGSHCE
ncbi:unnamed protein product [Symbiodinium sp. CCMP2592]|nr:unnamed protein product [Symbiodinium sp. CCMP2592]